MNDVQAIMDLIERKGAPPKSKEQWRDLLEKVISECEMRLEAVKEELDDDELRS